LSKRGTKKRRSRPPVPVQVPDNRPVFQPAQTPALIAALLCAALTAAWWAVHVKYTFGGKWNALYCVGGTLPMPPEIEAENLVRFTGTIGYDGQWYHLMAHDPLMKRNYQIYMDHPALRYPRILMPAAAWVLAAGNERYVDLTYGLICLGSVFLGVYWLASLAQLRGRSAWWGTAFLLLPAYFTSIDRLLTDAMFCALCLGLLYYHERGRPAAVWLILAAACLTRESGVLLLAAYGGYLFVQRRRREALWMTTPALPYLAWLAYSLPRITKPSYTPRYEYPLAGIVQLLPNPPTGREMPPFHFIPSWVVNCASLAAMLTAFALTFWLFARRRELSDWCAVPFAALGLYTASSPPTGPWSEAYAYGRIFSPVLALLIVKGFRWHLWPGLLLSGVITARILLFYWNGQVQAVWIGLTKSFRQM
jgi:hypothetical protein